MAMILASGKADRSAIWAMTAGLVAFLFLLHLLGR